MASSSFPSTSDQMLSDTAQQMNGKLWQYALPDEDYRRLFLKVAESDVNPSQSYHAGWVTPDDLTKCKPVFIAHSTVLAIQLLQATLPKATLSDENWAALIDVAQKQIEITTNTTASPLSQLSHDSPSQLPHDSPSQIPHDAPSPLSIRNAKRPRIESPPMPSHDEEIEAASQRDIEEMDVDAGENKGEEPQPQSEGEPQAQMGEESEEQQLQSENVSQPQSENESQPQSENQSQVRQTRRAYEVRVPKITSNNVCVEKRRQKSGKNKTLKKKESVNLVKPKKNAPPCELAAYNSITDEDKDRIAWIIKKRITTDDDNDGAGAGDGDGDCDGDGDGDGDDDENDDDDDDDDMSAFYNSTRTPYTTATTMLENARAV